MTRLKLRLARRFVSFVLPDVRKLLANRSLIIKPAPNSFEGKTVPEVLVLYGRIGIRFLKIFTAFPHLMKIVYYARRSIKSVRKNPANPKKYADDGFFQELEEYAKKLGVSAIGYTKVPREYIFKNRAIIYKNAIVLIMEMKKERIKKAPDVEASREVWRTYAALSKVVYRLSDFMRKRGYAAQPDPPIGGSTCFPLLAQKAGLGYIGKHGLLISEKNGPSERIAAIYTNIENLPLTDHDVKLYSWIPEFCEICNRCVRECPAKAIYPEPIVLEDGHLEHINYKKCAVVFSETLGCSICIKECTFFKGDFPRIKEVLRLRKHLDKGRGS